LRVFPRARFTVPLPRGRTLQLGDRTAVMAIVNVTPDSFADAGGRLDPGLAIARAERLIAETIGRFKRIDILVCNAGVWEGAAVEEIPEELWDRTMDINLKGTWTVCRAAIPLMKQQRFGRIVVVSSTAGQRGEANVSNYAAAKGGQISFTKSLAPELASFGINVNAVAPGWVDTELNEAVFADGKRLNSIMSTIPLGKVASADDIACPIVFLCSDWARHITGEILNVNGGSVLCG